jgi:luciferase family oxidoreductase group 1
MLLSILDLAPIVQGHTAADALRNSLDLARHAERWGYTRYWLAEHHNMTGIASAATAVVIGHVAAGTRRIRVGAGGIMLPNHAPLIVAEQFGTLETLFPGRIDLGLGRAPGSDQTTARALRRTLASNPDQFPQDILELMSYFSPVDGQSVRAVPGVGLRVPIYILGSSLFGAQVAAAFGLPFAFASHFAPGLMTQAVQTYRDKFRPSADLREPYVILGMHIVAADSDEEARYLWTSAQEGFINLRRGNPGPLPPPRRDFELSANDRLQLQDILSSAAIGGPETVHEAVRTFAKRNGADEIIAVAQIYDHAARLRSYEIAAGLIG